MARSSSNSRVAGGLGLICGGGLGWGLCPELGGVLDRGLGLGQGEGLGGLKLVGRAGAHAAGGPWRRHLGQVGGGSLWMWPV